MSESVKNVQVIDHALVEDSLSILRDKDTNLELFRYHSNRICSLLVSESFRDLKTKQTEVQTPLASMQVKKLTDEVIIIPVLRAGIAMLFGVLEVLPQAKVGIVGLKRDEETAIAHEYYWNLPKTVEDSTIIVTDPMLATGGTIYHVLEKLQQVKSGKMKVVCVVAAPEGIKKVNDAFPNVQIITGAIDERLNDKAFIVPGLGDYGDRYFGTL